VGLGDTTVPLMILEGYGYLVAEVSKSTARCDGVEHSTYPDPEGRPETPDDRLVEMASVAVSVLLDAGGAVMKEVRVR
jgi:hypothetical protein